KKLTDDKKKIKDAEVTQDIERERLKADQQKRVEDDGMYEFKRQLEYKTLKFSSQLILVDRMFPSSQICSNCGNHRHKMPLSERIYVCPECGHIEDRDINASKNIERWFEGIFIPVRSELTHLKFREDGSRVYL
ncbi:MAG: transposase, partial [Cyanobacteriota bacterium]|nr:transposase [Cyanobacteriota bacterium]